jgi:hypothetical protein
VTKKIMDPIMPTIGGNSSCLDGLEDVEGGGCLDGLEGGGGGGGCFVMFCSVMWYVAVSLWFERIAY